MTKDIASFFGYAGILHIYRNGSETAFIIVFYIGITTVVIFCLGFLYSFVTLKRQKAISGIIVGPLRVIITLITSILYMPFLDSFIIMMNCQSDVDLITN